MDIVNPHDKIFRETWSDKAAALEFLKHYLPQEILQLVDLNSLEISKDSFVEKELKEYFSDLLYKVKFEQRQGYVYFLFEHKSYPVRLIHLQLLDYMLKIWRLHLKQKNLDSNIRQLPIILPMVLYHGRRGWPFSTKFSDILGEPANPLIKYVPDFEYILHDLTHYADDEIKGTVLSRIVTYHSVFTIKVFLISKFV